MFGSCARDSLMNVERVRVVHDSLKTIDATTHDRLTN